MVNNIRMDTIINRYIPRQLSQLVYKMRLLLVSLVAFYNVSAQTPAKTIPDFTFFKPDKTVFTQKDVKSETLSFFIFFDVTCDHCQKAIKKINEHIGEFKKTSLYIITLDTPASVDQFLNTYGKNLLGKNNVTLLFDLKNQFIVRFGPHKYPSLFLYSLQKQLLLYDDNPDHLKNFFDKIKALNK
jgi:peroxiredoxin